MTVNRHFNIIFSTKTKNVHLKLLLSNQLIPELSTFEFTSHFGKHDRHRLNFQLCIIFNMCKWWISTGSNKSFADSPLVFDRSEDDRTSLHSGSGLKSVPVQAQSFFFYTPFFVQMPNYHLCIGAHIQMCWVQLFVLFFSSSFFAIFLLSLVKRQQATF